MIREIFSIRNVIGSVLFLILVGEPQVSSITGLFTPAGVIVFFSLYFTTFILFEAIIDRYKPNNAQLFLLTFALYSVLVTGFLHAEIADYALHPQNTVAITIIRIQASLFTFYAYNILNRYFPRKTSQKILSLGSSILLFALFILIVTFTGKFGLFDIILTFQKAPVFAIVFAIVGTIALYLALKKRTQIEYNNKFLLPISILFLLIGCIPLTIIAFPYMILMIIISVILLLNKPPQGKPWGISGSSRLTHIRNL